MLSSNRGALQSQRQRRGGAFLVATEKQCMLSSVEAMHAQRQRRGCAVLEATEKHCSLSSNGEAVQFQRQRRGKYSLSGNIVRQCSLPASSLALGIVCITLFYHVETFVKQFCNFSLHWWFMKFSVDMTLYDTCRGMYTNNSCQFSIWISFLILSFEGSFLYTRYQFFVVFIATFFHFEVYLQSFY